MIQALSTIHSTNPLYKSAIRRLMAFCHLADIVPSSCKLPDDIPCDRVNPFSSSSLSDVYEGYLGDRKVALKSIRIHVNSRTRVRKVRVIYS